MREGRASQAFLSLFTTPDRAASIVGDLLEESASQRGAWYALKVLGIALAMCLRTVRSAPVRCLALAALGCAVYLFVWAVAFVGAGLPWYPWQRIGEPGFWIRVAVVVMCANLATGFVLARWVSIRGTNALAPLSLLWLVAWATKLALVTILSASPLPTPLVLGVFADPLVALLPLFVGGMMGRARADLGRLPRNH
jgi:hypothetical protein